MNHHSDKKLNKKNHSSTPKKESKNSLPPEKGLNPATISPNKIIVIILVGSLTLSMLIFDQLNNPLAKANSNDYRNPNLPIEARVEDLLSRMTLEEKIGQMPQIAHRYLSGDNQKIWQDRLGSVLIGGGGAPHPNILKLLRNYIETAAALSAVSFALQSDKLAFPRQPIPAGHIKNAGEEITREFINCLPVFFSLQMPPTSQYPVQNSTKCLESILTS